MPEEAEKSIYDLELHEEIYLKTGLRVLRVPGGWIYTRVQSLNQGINTISQSITGTFVPFFKEATPKKKSTSTALDGPDIG